MRAIALLLTSVVAVGQQPNTADATLRINAAGGPPFPIVNVSAPRGVPQNVAVTSSATQAPFVLLGAAGLYPIGWPVFGGELLDVDIAAGGFVLLDGISDPAINTGATGSFNVGVVLPATTPVGTQAAFQAGIAVASAPGGVRLSAATQIVTTQGITNLDVTPTASNAGALLDLVPFGVTFPFYGTTYTRLFVNTDGNITFGSASGDFVPHPATFETMQPRIAPMWTEFNLLAGSSVTAVIDQSGFSGAGDLITVSWNALGVAPFAPPHSFSVTLNALTGDISIVHPINNLAVGAYAELMGITPGQSLTPPGGFPAATDLSALPTAPVTGQPMGAFWEMFGIPGMVFYPSAVANLWDMPGTTTTFLAISPGTPAAAYIGM